jgi:hypothetical protein
MMRNGFVLAALLAFVSAPALADVVISTDATQNMSCSGGVCAPTATNAVLNVSDLENYLASGDLSVVTTNSGIQANNIDITAPFSWSAAHDLKLDAWQSITFTAVVQSSSTSKVSLITNDGGSGGALTFTISRGRLDTNKVYINGSAYKMAASLKELAADVNAHPAGNFALSHSTDASKDGTYSSTPIPVKLTGSFNGLGHQIANLKIATTGFAGLFGSVAKKGSIASVEIGNASVTATGGAWGAIFGGREPRNHQQLFHERHRQGRGRRLRGLRSRIGSLQRVRGNDRHEPVGRERASDEQA